MKKEALDTAPKPPSLWKRCVDDTFDIQEEQYKNEFFHHINSLDDNIKFTAESTKAEWVYAFLDTLVTPQSDAKPGKQSVQKAHSHQSISAVGTATMPYPTNTASSVHYYIEPRTFAPTNNYSRKNKHKYIGLSQHVNILIGQLTG